MFVSNRRIQHRFEDPLKGISVSLGIPGTALGRLSEHNIWTERRSNGNGEKEKAPGEEGG